MKKSTIIERFFNFPIICLRARRRSAIWRAREMNLAKSVASWRLTFSMSLSVAGDTSECRRSSGDRGGANPEPRDPLPDPALPEFRPIFTSECRRCSVSTTGTSSRLSVEFCVSTGCRIDELCCFRRQMLQHHVFCEQHNVKIVILIAVITGSGSETRFRLLHWTVGKIPEPSFPEIQIYPRQRRPVRPMATMQRVVTLIFYDSMNTVNGWHSGTQFRVGLGTMNNTSI